MNRILFGSLLLMPVLLKTHGQVIPDPEVNPDLLTNHWTASWVTVPGAPAYDYGVYYFRNELEMNTIPDEYIVHVSADNRYKFFVNGQWIGLGPARSNADNWMFETYDIAGYLKEGANVVAAIVWNFGEYKPWAQLSLFTGFIVQGNAEKSSELNTPGTWKCSKIEAYEPLDVDRRALGTFIIVGPGEKLRGNKIPWNWQSESFNMEEWQNPQPIASGAPKGVGTDITHALVPRTIPGMELRRINEPVARKIYTEIINKAESKVLKDYRIPANTSETILLDQQELVTAYPEFIFSGGKDAKVKATYAEALYDDTGKKRHRDSVRDMEFKGNSDLFIPDGGTKKNYTTLWFRTFRYVQLEIETSGDPLVINNISSIFTGYPFEEKAYFNSSDPSVKAVWETGWRTSRLCANELFYDCPYYEQMQYVGDTRIQALISLYVSGDDRLMRKSINDFYNSIIPEGLTLSRYPTEPRQVIPTYSLFWISMIHDYLWLRNDYLFAARYLTSIQHVLQWFENRIDNNTGMLGPIEYWPFVDWTKEWPWDNDKRIGGVPPGGLEGNSSIITLQYAMTLDQAADIFGFFGLDNLAADYLSASQALIDSTRTHCWDNERGLFADTPAKKSFSQHANTFAILAHAVNKNERALFMEKILRDESLIQSSLYFRYYVNRAAIESGLGNKYLTMMEPWYAMLEDGLTTFAEIPDTENTRSDCHAWSSSPLYELLATVAGIRPAAPGFESIIVEPHPGGLKWIKAGMPHFYGDIAVDLEFDKTGGVKGSITIPPALKGVFVWDHQTIDLIPGKQKISMAGIDAKFKVK
ncbi:MAG: alpha-L-rhamnosidase [Bacteroidales bacterium]|nr:alpha-L-rhamnosidase [Bacteroidales bacterium]